LSVFTVASEAKKYYTVLSHFSQAVATLQVYCMIAMVNSISS